jgi:hypothetical protein
MPRKVQNPPVLSSTFQTFLSASCAAVYANHVPYLDLPCMVKLEAAVWASAVQKCKYVVKALVESVPQFQVEVEAS